MRARLHVSTAILFAACCTSLVSAAVETYTWPAEIGAGRQFTRVEVAGVNSPILPGRSEDITTFSFSGTVTVRVTYSSTVTSVKIRPQRRGIVASVAANAFSFSLTNPENLCIEVNGNRDYPLLLFANPIETKPSATDPTVRYFAAGQVYDIGSLQVLPSSPHTIYIEGGAVVRGYVTAFNHDGDHLRILGRGILENQGYTDQLMNVSNANAFTVSGVIVMNTANQWTNFLTADDSLLFDNVKVITWNMLNDGMDVCGCHNATIRNCYFRTNDDCISPKANQWTGRRTTQNLRISNCVFWKDTFGMVFRIGGETDAPLFDSITISDCDIIRCRSWGSASDVAGCFRVDDEQGAVVQRLLVDNVTIEDPECNFTACFNVKNSPGAVQDIVLRNIRFVGDTVLPFLFGGLDSVSLVKNVTIDGVYLSGVCQGTPAIRVVDNPYTQNIVVTPCTDVSTPHSRPLAQSGPRSRAGARIMLAPGRLPGDDKAFSLTGQSLRPGGSAGLRVLVDSPR